MPTGCIAYGCFNNGKIEGISYHRFPTDAELRQRWVNAVKRKDWEPKKHSRICSSHFKEEDIDRSLGRVKIREGAVPVIFPHESHVTERRTIKRKLEPEVSFPKIARSPNKKLLKIELTKTKTNLNKYKQRVKCLQQKKRRLHKKVAKLEDILETLKKRLNFKEEECNHLSSISLNSDCLVNRAVQKTLNPNLKKEYDERLKCFAITLHFLSPKAYLFIRKTFNTALPHPRTLRRWYCSIDAEPGFSSEVFRALKEHTSNITNKPVICALMLDCMSIKHRLEWDGKRFHGTVNVGNTGTVDNDDSNPMAKEALVFHLVSMNSSWKVPLGHFFVASTSGEQLSSLVKQCLGLLHDSGIKVASLTCDGTSCNLAMANNLGCCMDPKNLVHWFPHPSSGERINFFLDPCHMLKLVRNTLADYKVLLDSENNRIEWKYIAQLHELQKQEGLHLGNRLTNAHINYTKQKMKVKLAAQVFSSSVADSLDYLLKNKVQGFEGCSATIEFLRKFDMLFDILNSRSIKAKYGKQALYPGNTRKHSEILLKTKTYISQLKDKLGMPILLSKRKTGFLGFIACVDSALAMYDEFVKTENGPLKYLPLYKVSQDHLERLFGYIRSRGGHNNNPTCREFTSSFKRIFLHRELQESNTGNALILKKTLIFSINKASSNQQTNETDDINSSTPGWRCLEDEEQELYTSEQGETAEDEEFFQIVRCTSNITRDIVEYIAGYVVRSVRSKIFCNSCSELLVSHNSPANSLIHCKNRGGLVQPSEGAVKLCLICESVVKVHINSGTVTTVKDLPEVMTAAVLRKCIGVYLFPNSEHHLEQEPENNHLVLLMKALCKKYFIVRLHHYSKRYSEAMFKTKIRNYLTKTVTFIGQ